MTNRGGKKRSQNPLRAGLCPSWARRLRSARRADAKLWHGDWRRALSTLWCKLTGRRAIEAKAS